MPLRSITPQQYFEGLDKPLERRNVEEKGVYTVRLIAEASLLVLRKQSSRRVTHWRPTFVADYTGEERPAEGDFRIVDIEKLNDHDAAWMLYASCDNQVYFSLHLLPSGILRSSVFVAGYLVGGAEEEEPQSDPSLNRDRPLVAA